MLRYVSRRGSQLLSISRHVLSREIRTLNTVESGLVVRCLATKDPSNSRASPKSEAGPSNIYKSPEDSGQDDSDSSLGWVKKNANTLIVGSAGLALAYASSRVFMYITTSFMSISFTDVFYAGFGTGAASIGTVAAAAYAVQRQWSIRPEQVHGAALGKLRNHPDVKGLLGNKVTSGSLRAYALRNGQLGFDSKGSFGWLHPRVHMLFSVEGDQGSGLVSLEAQKTSGGGLDFSLLTLDTLAQPSKPSQLLLVDGTEERLHVRGQLRGFLQTERVKYVAQTVPDEEDPALEMDEPPMRL